MDKTMDSGIIKKDQQLFLRHFRAMMPAMGWYFSSRRSDDAIVFPSGKWACMFSRIHEVASGGRLCFSKNAAGCGGAACYLGFKNPGPDAGRFLASKEKFKEKDDYGNAFYHQINAIPCTDRFLELSCLENIGDHMDIQVVNLWVDPLSLSGLVTLFNFDSEMNNNVSIPFASGCQGMWTMPYKEKDENRPRAIVGALDPAMRRYIAKDTLLFSVPANRFHVVANKIEKSFAGKKEWLSLVHQRPDS